MTYDCMGGIVVIETSSGKVLTHITIDKIAKAELKKRGIPIGSAAALWVSKVDEIKEYNDQINRMTENIVKMQDLLRRQAERIRELENPEPKEKVK